MNPHRAEVSLKALQQTYTLRLSLADVASLEAELGCGVYELIGRIQERKFGVREVAAIIRRGLRGGGMHFPQQRTGEVVERIMTEVGMPASLNAATDLLLASLADPAEMQEQNGTEPSPLDSKDETPHPLG